MAYGDLEAESPQSLTETNFLRLFRLAQLTVEYLLHIQDRLVWENGLLKVPRQPMTFRPVLHRPHPNRLP